MASDLPPHGPTVLQYVLIIITILVALAAALFVIGDSITAMFFYEEPAVVEETPTIEATPLPPVN